jgi:PRC-barrel domain
MRHKSSRRRQLLGALVLMAGVLIGFFGFMALAQSPGARGDPAELIGVAAFSAEGTEVGTVSAVTVDADGHITEIRLTTSSPLGLGTRTVAVPQGSFTALDGAVVLDLSSAEVDALPAPAIVPRKTSA